MKRPNIFIIAIAVAMPVMGMTIISPALSQIKSNLNISFSDTQLVLSMYFLSLAIGQLISGPLSDKFGRRPIIILGSIIYSFGAFGCLLMSDIKLLVISRMIQGIGAAACLSVGRTIISDCYERSEAAEKMSTVTAVMVIIPILCFIFGGIFADLIGWRFNFFVLSIVGLIVFIFMIFLLHETNKNKIQKIELLGTFKVYLMLFRNKVFLYFTFATGMQTAMFFSMNGFMPYEYLRLGVSLTEFGIWFSLTSFGYIVGNIVNSKVASKVGLENMCFYGTKLSLIVILFMFLNSFFEFQTPLTLSILCAFFGFTNGLVVANGMIGAINATKLNQGAASGLMGALQVGFGGIFSYFIILFGGATNFFISLIGISIMSIISIITSYMNVKLLRHRN